ncbi:MAG: hypothetical protein AB7L84_10415 [Acidimicrobiia bacterium]
MSGSGWRTTDVVAWTEHDGPGRPPTPGVGPWILATATLGVALSVIVMTDALCPEHRAWVLGLAAVSFTLTVVAVVGLVAGWSSAPATTVVAAAIGTPIGLIDALHDPLRGGAIAAGFALATGAGIWLVAQSRAAHRWDRRVAEAAGDATVAPVRAPAPVAIPEPAAVPAIGRVPAPIRARAAEPHDPR